MHMSRNIHTGTYNPSTGGPQEQCRPCPDGYSTVGSRSTSSNDCTSMIVYVFPYIIATSIKIIQFGLQLRKHSVKPTKADCRNWLQTCLLEVLVREAQHPWMELDLHPNINGRKIVTKTRFSEFIHLYCLVFVSLLLFNLYWTSSMFNRACKQSHHECWRRLWKVPCRKSLNRWKKLCVLPNKWNHHRLNRNLLYVHLDLLLPCLALYYSISNKQYDNLFLVEPIHLVIIYIITTVHSQSFKGIQLF